MSGDEYFTSAGDEPRLGTLADLGAIEGMPSLPTLQRFIAARSDFPVIERGRYGKAYLFDLAEAAAFVRTHWRDQRRLHLGDTRLAQLALPLIGEDNG